MPKSKDPDHLDEMLEWQQKQYTPWKYAQEGKLPPHLKARGNKKLAAALFFFQGGVCLLILALTFANSDKPQENWAALLSLAIYSALCFFVASGYLRQQKAEVLQKEKRKKKGR